MNYVRTHFLPNLSEETSIWPNEDNETKDRNKMYNK